MVSQPEGLEGAALHRVQLYATRSRLYLVGHNSDRTKWRVLKFARGQGLEVTEDAAVYTERECSRLLQEIRDGNRNAGGLSLLCMAHGVAGCVRFLEGYYLILIKERRYVARICDRPIYGMEQVQLQPIMHPDSVSELSRTERAHEQRYQKLLLQVLENKEFFFSYSYNLHQTLQANLMHSSWGQDGSRTPSDPFTSMFVWNQALTKDLRCSVGNSNWVIPLVHGFWQQRSLSIFGKIIRVTLIARRSRHFAGTRYRKRGVNKQGYVANDVETEQVVDASGEWRGAAQRLSSVVQVRGSIPMFWNQDEATLTQPKPDITLQHFDPLFNATRLHFKDLAVRYGCPIVVLNLVKKDEKSARESILGDEFADAVSYLNMHLPEDEKLEYIAYDFREMARMVGRVSPIQVIKSISEVVRKAITQSGIFSYRATRRRLRQQPNESVDNSYASELQISSGSIVTDEEADLSVVHIVEEHSTHGSSAQKSNESVGISQQAGVLRTNCIDCLDRTNVAQYAFGLVALGVQFEALGVTTTADIGLESSISVELGHMYEAMGNCLAQQYGGSDAHTKFFKDQRGEWGARTHGEDVMTSLRRFYSNINTDPEKQDAMNLFLGRFVPQPGKPPVWELGNDSHLHASRGLLFDDNNFDIFWGETLGQSASSDRDRHESHGANTGYLPREPSWSHISSSLGSDQGATESDAASALDPRSRSVSVSEFLPSGEGGSPLPSESSSIGMAPWQGAVSKSPSEGRVEALLRSREVPYSVQKLADPLPAGDLHHSMPQSTVFFLDEIMEQTPSKVTEVRIFTDADESEQFATGSLRFMRYDSTMSPPKLSEGMSTSNTLAKKPTWVAQTLDLSRILSSGDKDATPEARQLQRSRSRRRSPYDTWLDSPAAIEPPRARRASCQSVALAPTTEDYFMLARSVSFDLSNTSRGNGASYRGREADVRFASRRPGRIPGQRTYENALNRRRTKELGWPEHPLKDVPAGDFISDGTREEVEGRLQEQYTLLWDTVVMDWVHGHTLESSAAPTLRYDIASTEREDCHLSMLGSYPEDVDLTSSIIDPSAADEVFGELLLSRRSAQGSVWEDTSKLDVACASYYKFSRTMPLDQNLLDELFSPAIPTP